jgi:hypothetical protein
VKIQTFIFNWPGRKQHAATLEAMFRRHCQTTVINSDDSLRLGHPRWRHIGANGYFTDQWNAAMECFDADIFVHIQADVWPTQVERVLSECVRHIKKHDAGIYAPNVDFNPHIYRKQALQQLHPGVYEVPATDCSFWAIPKKIIENTPRIDPQVNRLGWGIEYVVGAVARMNGLKIFRDYRFTAGHLKFRGYDNETARKEWLALKAAQGAPLRQAMESLEEERDRLVVQNSWRNPILQRRIAAGY